MGKKYFVSLTLGITCDGGHLSIFLLYPPFSEDAVHAE